MTNPIDQNLYRDIVEAIRSTLDIKVVKQKIVGIVGKALNADRCFILEYDKNTDKFFRVSDEYLSSIEIPKYAGTDLNENIPKLALEFKNGKNFLLNQTKAILDGEEIDLNDESFEAEKKAIEYYKVYSALVFPIYYLNDFLGDLVLHYLDKTHEAGENEINLLKDIASQISIAIHQANLYETVQKKAKKEFLLRSIIEASRKSLNFETSSKDICKAITELFKVERVSIGKSSGDRVSNVSIFTEYTTRKNVKTSKSNINFSPVIEYWKNYLLENFKTKPIDNVEESDLPQIIKKTYQEIGVKSLICLPLGSEGYAWGGLFLAKYDSYIEWTKEQIELLETVASQVYIAMRQSELYEKQKELAKREKLLQEITEKIRSSLDIEKTLDFICEEVTKIFDVQRVTMLHFYDPENFENYSIRREYKTNINLKGLDYTDYLTKAAAYWDKHILEVGEVLGFDNIQEAFAPDYFKNCYTTMGVKSMIGVPIKSKGEQWGTLVLSEYNKYRHWSNEEKSLLSAIASQVYIAINQAELYEAQKNMTERERINRNIIEILRSSIDKTIIKKLFVKNIGKFFNADRVFLAEYDFNEKKFMPVDKNSEYLSSPNEKSFIGIDWSQHCIREYYQTVHEKREIKIFSLDEYIKDKKLEGDIVNLLEEAKVKSSYSFPVFYQDKVMGSFCIDFTKRNIKLSDEDINRIRNMCTQAGVALYHAELYEKAQQCNSTKESFKIELLNNVKAPTQEILDTSIILTKNEFERSIEVEYLNKIISSCHQLLELTNKASS